MTKDQFAVWLAGYMAINVFGKFNYGNGQAVGVVDYQKMGDDVLEAAWSVVSMPLANPIFPQQMTLTPETPARATTGQLDTKRIPQPGDLDYEGPK